MAIDTAKTYYRECLLIVACLLLTSCNNTSLTDIENARHKTDKTLLNISAVGDIMLGGTAEPVLEELSYHHPFRKVSHLLDDSAIVIGNLEGPLTHSDTAYADKAYLFKTPPEQVAPALKQAGFTILNLANNHIMDYGPDGLMDTMRALEKHSLHHVGAGLNLGEARAGKIIEISGHKVGFLSYSLTFPQSFWATSDTPGAAFGHEKQIREDIRNMKQLTDIVIASFHWGKEISTELREYQPLLAHAAIDEGASMVIGHHPHVLQAVERYKNGVILYSLGNFTFGSYSQHAEFSVVATASFLHKKLYSLKLTPINVLNVDVNFQPRIMPREDADQVIEHINRLSRPHNTQLSSHQGTAILYISPVSAFSTQNSH